MGNLVYRGTKGSALTYGEMDGNFLELDNRTKTAWKHLRANISTSGPNPPTRALYKNSIYLDWFDPDNMMECTASFSMPMDYIAGSAIWPHGHVVSATAGVGTVRWGFALTWANPYTVDDVIANNTPRADQLFGAPATFYKENAKLAWDQDLHRMVLSDSALSLPQLQPHSVLLMRVFRDAAHPNDTYPDPVAVIAVGITYQSFGPGSQDYK